MPDTSSSRTPIGNRILASLSDLKSQPFFPHLERVSLKQGEVVYEPRTRIEYVYFPETAILSLLCTMEDGSTIEVGPVGFEGMAGLRVFFGAATARYRVIVHVAGEALRLSADRLREELRSQPNTMSQPLLRYTQMMLAMTGQSSACNGLHTLEQRLARWLLLMSDYVEGELALTHDLMSLTLGVRRAGVSQAANQFKEEGLIKYRRGHIELISKEGLMRKACECYGEIKEEYDLLFADLGKKPSLSGR